MPVGALWDPRGAGRGSPIPHPSPLLLCSQGLVGASLVLYPRPSLKSWGVSIVCPTPHLGEQRLSPQTLLGPQSLPWASGPQTQET